MMLSLNQSFDCIYIIPQKNIDYKPCIVLLLMLKFNWYSKNLSCICFLVTILSKAISIERRKILKKEKKNKRIKEKKVPFRLVMKDTVLALKLCFKHAPFACIFMLLSYILDSLIGFMSGTYALKLPSWLFRKL